MSGKPYLGEFLVERNLASEETVNEALRIQIGSNRKLGYILVKMKAITADKMAEALSEHLGKPIIEIDKMFSPEAKKIIPRYLCEKYGVLPLASKKNNILELAMSDPMDTETISDLERYTEMVIEPFLARHSDIEKGMGNLSFSLKNHFNPHTKVLGTGILGLISLVLLVGLGIFTFNYIQKERYGSISESTTHTLYKNHDLILGIDTAGKVSLLGHGAFSDGYYSVAFDNSSFLKSFLQTKEKDFSEKQLNWLDWAITQVDSHSVAMQ